MSSHDWSSPHHSLFSATGWLLREARLRMIGNFAIKLASRLAGRTLAWRFGRSLYLHARMDVANDMNFNGESLLQSWILSSLSGRPGFVIFDVGANVGDWSWLLLETARAKSIANLDLHAFEPMPRTADALEARLSEYDDVAKVHIVRIAASDSRGLSRMYEFGERLGINSLHEDAARPSSREIQVRLDTIDNYCAESGIDSIDLLKCDTEGHDMAVMRGAFGMLSEQKIGVLQFEYNIRWVYSRSFLKDAFDLATQLPYEVGKLTPLGIELYERWDPELERFFEGNYVLVQRQLLGAIPHWHGQIGRHMTYQRLSI